MLEEQSHYRALIADSSPFYRRTIATILDKLDFTVVGTTSSLGGAIKTILRTNPNIIIFDILMPDNNGMVFLKKYQEYLDNKYFIILTGLNLQTFIIGAIKSGVADFLTKPLKEELFIRSLLKVKQKIDKKE